MTCHQTVCLVVQAVFRPMITVSRHLSIGRPQGHELDGRRTKAVSSWGLDISGSLGLVTIACFVGVLEPEIDGCSEALARADTEVTLSGGATVDGIQ